MDAKRVALVVATAADGKGETTASGYFLTGNLVLTARHAVTGSGVSLRVRSEVGGPLGEAHWTEAKLVWSGGPTVDAALLRTKRTFDTWSPPRFDRTSEAGSWKSSGFPTLAVDDNGDLKTWPLVGSFGISGGMGHAALALTTDQVTVSAARWDTDWKGLSGAPIFSTEGCLLGVIVEANRRLGNGLLGLPIQYLLDDVAFLPALTPSFLGDLPEDDEPWCLVVTSEGCGSSLTQEVEAAISCYREEVRFQELQLVEMSVIRAIESFENWSASVEALAKADYVVADVTGFEPAVMLLLGVRAVLRRGVTVSVTKTDLATHALVTPFNVRETRVLSYDDPESDFYDDLYSAMRDGADSMDRDRNYLDLPAYHAVRTPRAETVVADEAKSPLVLCPFSHDYATFYDARLRKVIRKYFREPRRMLDLRSPRLVGQALYEHIRWTRLCIVDWTDWRPNVFFEFGVRLACSAHDPFVLLADEVPSRDDEASDRDQRDREQREREQREREQRERRQRERRQREQLVTLFAPVRYDRRKPLAALDSPLKGWCEARADPSWRMPDALAPSGGTFAVAQQSYVWRTDETLTAPHTEQQAGAERILGEDEYQRPVPLVLFADNETFDAELRDAAREKWIAAWLYLDHLSGRRDGSENGVDRQLVTVGRLARRALAPSTEQRHVALREEIAEFLGREDVAELLRQILVESGDVRGLKESARDGRDAGRWQSALKDLNEARAILQKRTPEDRVGMADIWGQIGGIKRRWGLSTGPADRVEHLRSSIDAYDEGFTYEERLGSEADTTYNRLNRLVGRVLVSPSVLDGVPYDAVDLDHELAEVERVVAEQRDAARVDAWSYCDLATAQLLRSRPAAKTFDDLDNLRPKSFVYGSHLDTLRPLADVAGHLRPELLEAIERQEQRQERAMRSAAS